MDELVDSIEHILGAFSLKPKLSRKEILPYIKFDLGIGRSSYLISYEEKNVGFARMIRGEHRYNQHVANLDMGVDPEFRGAGIATLFLEKLEEEAKKVGIKRLEVELLQSNFAGLQLYVKNAFKIEGKEEKTVFSNGEYLDCYRMAKFI